MNVTVNTNLNLGPRITTVEMSLSEKMLDAIVEIGTGTSVTEIWTGQEIGIGVMTIEMEVVTVAVVIPLLLMVSYTPLTV